MSGSSADELEFSMRWLICSVLVVAAFVAAPRGQEQRGVAGQWTVTLEFPQLNIKETLTLDFRPGVRPDPNGRLRRGFKAVRQRPDLGPNRTNTYFLRMVDRRIRMSIDQDEMCDIGFESNDSFSGRCHMIGIIGTVTARRNPNS